MNNGFLMLSISKSIKCPEMSEKHCSRFHKFIILYSSFKIGNSYSISWDFLLIRLVIRSDATYKLSIYQFLKMRQSFFFFVLLILA